MLKNIVLIILTLALIGMAFLWWHSTHQSASAVGTTLYTCPMHPSVIQDHPGDCPICGMKLVPKTSGGAKDDALPTDLVALSPRAMVLANVALETLRTRTLSGAKHYPVTLETAEDRKIRVPAYVMGRIDTLFVRTPNATVSAGSPLFAFYSPELFGAQQELLSSPADRKEDVRQKLRLWRVSEDQIAAIEREGHPRTTIRYTAPVSGAVMMLDVREGQEVMAGMTVIEIVPLGTLWAWVYLTQEEMAGVTTSQSAQLEFPGQEQVTARVAFVDPMADMMSRRFRVRLDVPAGGKLRPGMWGTAQLANAEGAPVLALPISAVDRRGMKNVVFVQSQPGHFQPREVQLGGRVGDWVPVLAGLMEGEVVAASGTFLLDSEAELTGVFGQAAAMPANMPGMDMGDSNRSYRSNRSEQEPTATKTAPTLPEGLTKVGQAIAQPDSLRKLVTAQLGAAWQTSAKPVWICPMGCNALVYGAAGECKICGMNLVKLGNPGTKR